MSRRARLDPRAAEEFEQAADWYEQRQSGLGREFVLEVRATVQGLTRSPNAGSAMEGMDPMDVRRAYVHRFPYQVIYLTKDDDVVVIAVAHDRRRPGYWASRTEST